MRSVFAILALLAFCFPAEAKRKVQIGVVMDGPWDRNDEMFGTVNSELQALLGDEFDIGAPPRFIRVADFTRATIESAFEDLLADPAVDVVITGGVLASRIAVQRKRLPKPVIASYIVDAELQGAPVTTKGTSGRRNLTFIQSPEAIRQDFETFQRLVPFKRLAVLAPPVLMEAVPGLGARLSEYAQKLGFEAEIYPVAASAKSTLAALPPDVDAVYLTVLVETPNAELRTLVDGINARRVPTFSFWGLSEVDAGVLATSSKRSDLERRARRVALTMQRVLLGEDAGRINVGFRRSGGLVLNMATAKKIGFSPRWDILTEAEIVQPIASEGEATIDLRTALSEALAKNLSLRAEEQAVLADRTDIAGARANLLPSVNASLIGAMIDSDRAAASFGSAPERRLMVRGTLKQPLYVHGAWAAYDAQKSLHRRREQDRDAFVLDLKLDTIEGYLNVLKARAVERIRRQSLRTTQANLRLARTRDAIGVSGPSELLRWQSEIANDRKDLIASTANRNSVEIALNQLLHRRLEGPVVPDDSEADDLVAKLKPLQRALDNPSDFRAYRRFMVDYGLRQAHELRGLQSTAEALEATRQAALFRYFVPTLGLEFQVDHTFAKDGEGTTSMQPAGGAGADDTTWQGTMVLALPLFEGLGRQADLEGAERQQAQVRENLKLLEERIGQRIRTTLHQAGASRSAIELSQKSREASGKNLDIVTDAYSQGVVGIVALLDAQEAYFVSSELAVNAVLDHLIDVARVSRSVSNFEFFEVEDGCTAHLGRFEKYKETSK